MSRRLSELLERLGLNEGPLISLPVPPLASCLHPPGRCCCRAAPWRLNRAPAGLTPVSQLGKVSVPWCSYGGFPSVGWLVVSPQTRSFTAQPSRSNTAKPEGWTRYPRLQHCTSVATKSWWEGGICLQKNVFITPWTRGGMAKQSPILHSPCLQKEQILNRSYYHAPKNSRHLWKQVCNLMHFQVLGIFSGSNRL